MEEFRVDMRLTTPEEQAKYMQQGALLHRFNNCMPYSAEKQEAAKALFGDNLGEGSMVQPPLKGVCFDMVHIGKNVMIMPDCLMMSRGGITIEGHTIKEYKGVVSGEVIFGMNFLKDFGASLRDFFGGRTDSYEKAMLEGRETAQREMRERAEKLGANAIVGVSFGYETMGQANSMIMISISGTAVVIK